MADGAAPEAPAPLAEARGWAGAKLDEMSGSGIGRVEGILVDAAGGEPTWLVARLGRFGRRCAIPYDFAAAAGGRVWVAFPRETIRAAAEVDPVGGLSCGDERELAELYGLAVRPPCSDAPPEEPASVPDGSPGSPTSSE